MNKTYFGVPIQEKNLLLLDDIKSLPFYDFWEESSVGSTQLVGEDGRQWFICMTGNDLPGCLLRLVNIAFKIK